MRGARIAAAAIAATALAVAAPGAGGQDTRALTFAHNGKLDGTAHEIHSGFFAGDPPSGDPLAARYADTYETFPVTVPDGTRHGNLRADISWADSRVNLDLYVYRLDASGHAINPAVARSTGTGRASESAVYAPSGTVPPGTYLVVVDNICSRDADQDPRSPMPKRAACGIGQDVPDEDDFSGTVTLGNQIPTASIEGPDRTPAKQSTTYEAVADDLDGEIVTYQWDLDGDGVYETDSDGNSKVTTTFPTRGDRTIGVQVLDDSGAVAIASKTVTVTRAVKTPDTRPPIVSFALSTPTFGGAGNHSLVIRYRLLEKSRVEVKLRRKGKLVRLIDRGVRKSQHTYRIVLRPAHLRRGVYTVQIFVASRTGKHQVEQRSSRRR